MALADLDATLHRLQDAAARIATNLFELERDPTVGLLEAAPLEGQTAIRWADATRAIGELWRCYTSLTATLDEATRVRGTKAHLASTAEAALARLVEGQAIEVASTVVPVHARELLGSQRTTTRCSADELLALMSESFDRVKGVVADTARAWDELVPRLATARAAFGAKIAEAANVDAELRRELESLRPRLDALANMLMADPLAVSVDAVDSFERDLTNLGDALLAAVDLHADLEARLATARTNLDAAQRAIAEAADAYRVAIAKIAHPPAIAPPSLDPALEAQLDEIARLTIDGRACDACTLLDTWLAGVDATLADANTATEHDRGLIETRNQLRGRLDAYFAMAQARDLVEDSELTNLYEAAHTTLFTAPTDLGRAGEQVARYQRAVTTRREILQ